MVILRNRHRYLQGKYNRRRDLREHAGLGKLTWHYWIVLFAL